MVVIRGSADVMNNPRAASCADTKREVGNDSHATHAYTLYREALFITGEVGPLTRHQPSARPSRYSYVLSTLIRLTLCSSAPSLHDPRSPHRVGAHYSPVPRFSEFSDSPKRALGGMLFCFFNIFRIDPYGLDRGR